MLTMVMAMAMAAPRMAALGTTATLPRTYVKSGAPLSLYLAMENRTDKKLTFENHVYGWCYLAKFANVRVEPAATMKPPPRPCPEPEMVVDPRQKVAMLIDLREVFELPADGQFTVFVEWKDGGPEIYSPLTAVPGTIRTATPAYEGRLAKDGTISLPDRSTLVFVGHKSLPSERRGEPPKLSIDLIHRVPGSGETPRNVQLDLDTRKEFDFGAYKITLTAHQFDQWMDVVVFPR